VSLPFPPSPFALRLWFQKGTAFQRKAAGQPQKAAKVAGDGKICRLRKGYLVGDHRRMNNDDSVSLLAETDWLNKRKRFGIR
jgi:hypothetical protein